jgi:CNT family concentrative nucleoside transporter
MNSVDEGEELLKQGSLMSQDPQTSVTPSLPPPPTPAAPIPPTPLAWRLALAVGVLLLGGLACLGEGWLGPRGRSALGVCCFLGVAFVFSANLRAINWYTIGLGFTLQVLLALLVLRFEPGYRAFEAVGGVVKKFLEFSSEGAQFVFGKLADPPAMGKVFGKGNGFVFAFVALPTIVFVSSFFSVLYHFGLLQIVVRGVAAVMRALMRTSGAETLSVTANVFMGQTEAPLIVKPYVERMTLSELLALMVGGMAHISGSLMAVYIGMGADAVAILATSVMASPCTLYLAKIILPETQTPETLRVPGTASTQTVEETGHANVIDAAAAGASDGMRLAINVAAMLIAFLAFIALFNSLLQLVSPELTLSRIFGLVFAPLAYLLGVEGSDVTRLGNLLGTKLVANEFVAYTEFQQYLANDELSERTRILATYALTGFANFASIGIQLGGIGAMAPSRRSDLARLGGRALFTGFLVTLVNAGIAGVLLQ